MTWLLNFHAVRAVADAGRVMPPQIRELGKILSLDFFEYSLLERRVDQGHAAALESGSAEAASVDAVGSGHDLVDLFQLWRAGLPFLDG